MEIYTIGFTKRSASQFFEALRSARIEQLVDIRLNNVSQLAGFTKRDDLAYFLSKICGAKYVHEPMLAPTQVMLDAYKKAKGSWETYASRFISLLEERAIEKTLSPQLFSPRTVLLCSEFSADHCHRRLVAEYLESKWGPIKVEHL